ncbi:AraC family transcriptional regulator [Paenibacillus cremeus]|uniref:AraC family transcriptional regulator n=1 Tax=Paenibacillus cremeus TaxID=2163881 RepID=A0A559K6I9_9BACL|nr:AraC family transcriptional regulator [Paenibacillus cremeus]TVY07726.1 AraC family transcriptional regulator [Paenibacillus cremeus]
MFNKLLTSYMVTICLLSLLIGSVYMVFYSHEVKSEYERSTAEAMSSMLSHADTLASNIDQLTLQLSLLPELSPMLSNPFQYSILQFGNVKEALRNQITTNSMLYSIYVYFKLNNKVLTTSEGLYPLDEFYDEAYVKRADAKQQEKRRSVRVLSSTVDRQNVEVITWGRPIPLTSSVPLGSLIVNVKRSVFFEVLYNYANVSSSDHVYVLDSSDFHVLSGPPLEDLSQSLRDLAVQNKLTGAAGLQRIELGGEEFFAGFMKGEQFDWTVVKLIPYHSYVEVLRAKLGEVIRIELVVLLIGFALAYLFSMRLSRPWKQVLASFTGGAQSARLADESTLVSEAIARLLKENEHIKGTLRQSEPIIRYRLLYDMLVDSLASPDVTEQQLANIGIAFPHRYFAALVVVADLRKYEFHEDYNRIKLLLFSLTEEALGKRLLAVGTILDHMHFGYVLNFEQGECGDDFEGELKQQLKEAADEVNAMAQTDFDLTLQFAFGRVYGSLTQVYSSYVDAKRAANWKALLHERDVVFFGDSVGTVRFDYPLELQKELIARIITIDRTQADEVLTDFFTRYVYNRNYPREQAQETIVMLMSSIIQHLYTQGYEMPSIPYSSKRVGECRNSSELERLLRECVHLLMDQLEQLQGKKHGNAYLKQATSFMEVAYHEIASVAEVATHVGISVSYLNSLFRTELGTSPLDYLTKVRIEQSKALLTDRGYRYSLQDICRQIGYNDVQSFIRFFKKHESMTPGEFRKRKECSL